MSRKNSYVSKAILLLLTLSLTSCFTARPKTPETGCEFLTHSWTLDFNATPSGLQIASQSCNSAECLLSFLVAGSAIAVGSFIVSGSIVLVGNTLHWIESWGTCQTTVVNTTVSKFQDTYVKEDGHVIDTEDELISIFKK